MKTAIIILNYNSEEDTVRFVNEIKEFESLDKIVVVDNLSPNGDFERLKILESEKVDVIQSERNGGYSYGNNYGIKHMENSGKNYDYVIISNPDIHIEEEAIKATLAFLEKNEKAAIAAPKMLNKEREPIRRSAWKIRTPGIDMVNSTRTTQILLNPIFKNGEYSENDFKREVLLVEAVSGAFFVIKYEILKEIDYFDENVFLFYEEDILASKIKKVGYKVYSLNNVHFEHFESNSINKAMSYYNKMKRLQASKMYYQKTYNNINVFQNIIFTILNFWRRFELLFEIPIRKFYQKHKNK